MAGNLIVAINRQYGSGGKEVGQKVADALGINCTTKRLRIAAKRVVFDKDYFDKADEKPTDSFCMHWR